MASLRATSSGRRPHQGKEGPPRLKRKEMREGQGVDWKTEQIHGRSFFIHKDQATRNAYTTVGGIEVRHLEELPAVRALETNRNG